MATSSNPSPKPPANANPSSNPSPQQQPRQFAPYQPPNSQEEINRELDRINLLLQINGELLSHINKLQSEGHGGALPGTPAQPSDKAASQDYIACLRATQANVAYLAVAVQGGAVPGAGGAKTKGTAGPLIMDSPVADPSLASKYETLRSLFPNWKGNQGARQAPVPNAQQQQQQQQLQAQAQAQAQAQQYAQNQAHAQGHGMAPHNMPSPAQPPPVSAAQYSQQQQQQPQHHQFIQHQQQQQQQHMMQQQFQAQQYIPKRQPQQHQQQQSQQSQQQAMMQSHMGMIQPQGPQS